MGEAFSRTGRRIINLLMAAMSACSPSDSDALHAIRGLQSIMHGFLDIERSGWCGLPLDLDNSYKRLVTVFIQSLRHKQVIGGTGEVG